MTKKQQRTKKPLSGRVLGVVSALDLAAIVVPAGLFLCLGDHSPTPLYVTAAAILCYFGWTLCVVGLFSRKRWQNRVLLAVNLLNLLVLISLAALAVALLHAIGNAM